MIDQPSFGLDIPAPGEPQQTEIHPHNQALIASEVARRVEMTRAKLSRFQLRSLGREYARLHRHLNRKRYNALITRRDELKTAYHELRVAYKSADAAERQTIRREVADIKRRWVKNREALNALVPTLARFVEVKQRLDTHSKILELERIEKENHVAFIKESAIWEKQIEAVFRQSPRLHHVKADSRGVEVKVIPKIQQVIIKPDRVYFQIKTVRQGIIDRFTGMWHSALPYGVDVKSLTSDETIENLTAACGRIVAPHRSPRSQNIFYVINRMDAADGIPKLVRFAQIEDHYPADRHVLTPWAAGMGEDRKITHFDFEQYPNILVAGSAGGGKSNLINALLCQLITMNSPDELRLILIDNKGGVELSHFEDIPHLLGKPIINTDGVLGELKKIKAIIDNRYQDFMTVKAKKLTDYNKRVKTPVPRVVVVIDELATLLGLGELTTAIHGELRTISSLGRAAGVHLVLSTQHPSVDVLPGWIKTNLTLRIATRMPNHTASQIVVDSITAAHLPEIPGRMVFRRGGFEVILQAPYSDDATIARCVKVAQQFPAAAWQLDGEQHQPPPAPVFGRDEYLKAAVALEGSLSYRKVFDNYAKGVISQSETKQLGEQVIEELLTVEQVEIEGVMYEIERLRRGYQLKLANLHEETEESTIDEASNPEIE